MIMLNRQSLTQFNKTYQNDALTMNVLGASPVEIIVLLYEGAQSALRKAKIEMVQRNFAEKGILIRKASDIIDGLNAALRMEVGSDIAQQLRDLYLYMKYRLSIAVKTREIIYAFSKQSRSILLPLFE